MKTLNFRLLLLAITVYSTLSGCGKEESHPLVVSSGERGGSSPQVISSEWFGANWEANSGVQQFVKTVPELSSDFLTTGRVLVFGKGGFARKSPTILASNFDANFIAADVRVDTIRLILEGSGSISPSLEFRYILIPSDQVVAANKLDYHDYNAVCDYYKIIK